MIVSPELEAKCLALAGKVNGVPVYASGPIATTTTEKAFMAAVISEAKRNGWRVYHTHDSRKSHAGFPDLLMLRGSRILVAELKVGDNRPTAAQSAWLEAFGDAGVEQHLWRPENWPEIVERLA